MAEGLNKVLLLGNVGQDPDFRVTTGGAALLKIRLATSEKYKDKQGDWVERTEWHTCLLWGRRGEAVSKFLKKGERVFVEGSIRTSSYEQDGVKKYKTEIVVSNIILAGVGKGRAAGSTAASAGAPASHEPEPMEAFGDFDRSDDDEIPF